MFEILDNWIFTQINSILTHPFMDTFFVWITDLHKTQMFKLFVVPIVAYLFIRRFKRQGVSLFLMLILALSLNDFVGAQIKKQVERPRPEFNETLNVTKRSDAGGYSFPSNHASNMFTFATYTSQFLPELKIPLYLIAASVAYSRIYNGVHYPSDVLAGGVMGCLWGFLFSILVKQILNYFEKRKKSV